MYQPIILFIILIITLALFVWGYWRYDFVALFALALSVLTGIVPAKEAFSGFSNPAVITVGCVMCLTYAITQSGVLNVLLSKLEFLFKKPLLHISLFTTTIAVISAFMNNVAALGLMMPIAIQSFINQHKSPSIILMPIAFSSVLGGIITLIGTPPNLLISSYRESIIGAPYDMFAFTPVGIVIAFFGVLFISTVGWKLVPVRQKNNKTDDLFQMSDYITEIKVLENSPFCDKTIEELLAGIQADFNLIAITHRGKKKFVYSKKDIIHKNDILIIGASSDNLEKFLDSSQLTLAGDRPFSSKGLSDSDIMIIEAVVPPGSNMEGRSATKANLRYLHSVNLLALSRKGKSFRKKLNDIPFAAGDVVLLQGRNETLRETIVDLGFLPLAERDVKIGISRKSLLPLLFFIASIILATLQVLPITISFLCAVLAVFIFKAIPTQNVYRSIDASVLILLAALIPIGGAIETTGAADLISNAFIQIAGQHSPVVALIAVLVVTMTLSDLMNNAATAVVMAPIAVNIARSTHVNIDTFLMAVAIGASCSFLTPIAHQNNTMVMGPGGYHFFDYARLGLILEIIIGIVAIPTLLWVWPLH